MQFIDIKHKVWQYHGNIKRWWQRRTRGWDDSDTWNLDYTLATMILPRLKRFKELNNGYPHGLTPEKWDEMLDQMIYGMEQIIENDNETKPIDKRALEGLELFGKYFRHLWW
jgi:hypothetical protein